MASLNKIGWVSGLRGLAILVVVLGHMLTPLSRHLYAWHLPLLFFLSGYLIKETDWKKAIFKDGLYVVKIVLVFGTLGVILELVKRWLLPDYNFGVQNFDLKSDFLGLFWWMDERRIKSYGLVLWFLPAWFWGKTIVKILIDRVGIWLMIIVGWLLWMWMSNNKVLLPFGLDKGMLVVFWIGLGVVFRKNEGKLNPNMWWSAILGIMIWFYLPVPLINLAVKWIEPVGLATVYPIIVILFWIGLVKNWRRFNKILGWWGDRSMWVYLIHGYVNNLTYLWRFGQFGWLWQFGLSILLLFLLLKLIDYVKTTKYASVVNWV